MKRGSKEERGKELYSNPKCSDTLEKSSYVDSTSSDWRLIEINILALFLVATRPNVSRCPTL